jgi:hypothetical protein
MCCKTDNKEEDKSVFKTKVKREFSKNCVSFICEFTIFSFDPLDAIFKGDFAVSQGRRRHGAVYIPLTNCKIDLTSHL